MSAVRADWATAGLHTGWTDAELGAAFRHLLMALAAAKAEGESWYGPEIRRTADGWTVTVVRISGRRFRETFATATPTHDLVTALRGAAGQVMEA